MKLNHLFKNTERIVFFNTSAVRIYSSGKSKKLFSAKLPCQELSPSQPKGPVSVFILDHRHHDV